MPDPFVGERDTSPAYYSYLTNPVAASKRSQRPPAGVFILGETSRVEGCLCECRHQLTPVLMPPRSIVHVNALRGGGALVSVQVQTSLLGILDPQGA